MPLGLLSVLGQMRLTGGNTDPILAKFVGFAVDGRPRTIQPLLALAARPVDEADPAILETQINDYLLNGYRILQLYVYWYNQRLRLDLSDNEVCFIGPWRERDKECLRKLEVLQLSPAATILKQTDKSCLGAYGTLWLTGE
jgi:hypothetical protein